VIAGQSVGSLVIIGDDEIEALRGLSVLAPRPHNQVRTSQAAEPDFVVANGVSALTRPCNGAGTTWPKRYTATTDAAGSRATMSAR
jgi:hypothetical protein